MSIFSNDDTYYSSVVLLLNGNASPITDDSLYTRAIAVAGGITQSATQKKFGGGALHRPSGNALQYAASSDFTLGTGDFTVECYRWLNYHGGGGYAIARANGASAQRWGLGDNGTNKLAWYLNGSAIVSDAANSVVQVWQHIAYSRSGGTGYLCCDGVVVASIADANDYSDTSNLGIFADVGTSYPTVAGSYLDFVRITKGVGRYTGTYTVPSEASEHHTLAVTADDWVLIAGAGAALQATSADWSVAAYGGGQLEAALDEWTFGGALGGALTEALSGWTVSGTGHESLGENGTIATLEDWSFAGAVGAYLNETTSDWLISATGAGTIKGVLGVTIDDWSLAATGTVSGLARASLDLDDWTAAGSFGGTLTVGADDWAIAASGYSGSVSSLAVALGTWTLSATGARGEHASLQATLDDWAAAAHTDGNLELGSWTLSATASGVVVATYEAYALNLKHDPALRDPVDELTRYTNFPFIAIVRFRGSYFGVGAAGLYSLEGTTDYAATPTAIPWAWRTTITDFGAAHKKSVESVYFGGRMPAAATVTAYVGESGSDAYSFTTPRGAYAQNYRQKLGRGMKTRYMALGASGSGDFTVDDLKFNIAQLARSI